MRYYYYKFYNLLCIQWLNGGIKNYPREIKHKFLINSIQTLTTADTRVVKDPSLLYLEAVKLRKDRKKYLGDWYRSVWGATAVIIMQAHFLCQIMWQVGNGVGSALIARYIIFLCTTDYAHYNHRPLIHFVKDTHTHYDDEVSLM